MSESALDSTTEREDRSFGLSRRMRERLLAVALVVLWLLFWEFSIQWGLLDPRFFPAPSAWLGTFVGLLTSGELWLHLSATIQRLVVGYLCGAIPALLLGWTIGRRRWLNAGCGPLLIILGAFPVTALLPLFWLIFGVELAKPAAVVVSVFFPVLYCARIGVRRSSAHADLVEGSHVSASLDANRVWSASDMYAYAFLGLKLATLISLLTLIAAEMLIRTNNPPTTGVGYIIWQSWLSFSVETLYVGIALAGALGALAWLAVDLLERLTLAVAARRAQRP